VLEAVAPVPLPPFPPPPLPLPLWFALAEQAAMLAHDTSPRIHHWRILAAYPYRALAHKGEGDPMPHPRLGRHLPRDAAASPDVMCSSMWATSHSMKSLLITVCATWRSVQTGARAAARSLVCTTTGSMANLGSFRMARISSMPFITGM